MLQVSYAHPDPEIAAFVANLFANAFLNYHLTLTIESAMKEVEDLRNRADQQQERVEALELKLADEREEKGIDGDIDKDLIRELEVQQGFLQTLVNRMSQVTTRCGFNDPYARIIDKAVAPPL